MPPATSSEERIAVLENKCESFDKTIDSFSETLKEFNVSLGEFNRAIERLKTLYENPTTTHCVFKDDIKALKEFMIQVKTGMRIAYVLVFGGGIVNLSVVLYVLSLLGKASKH